MDELQQVLSAAGEAGAVIVLVLSAVLIFWIIKSGAIEIAKLWRSAATERNSIDQKRNEIDDKVADTLRAVSDTLKRLQENSNESHDFLQGFRREHQRHDAAAITRHNEVMAELPQIKSSVTNNGTAIAAAQEVLMTNLTLHKQQLDQLLQKIAIYQIPESIRGDINKMLELVTTLSNEVKALRPSTDELTDAVERALLRAKQDKQDTNDTPPPMRQA